MFGGLENIAVLNNPIPLIGKSVAEILTGDPDALFEKLMDFTNVVTNAYQTNGNRTEFSTAEIQEFFLGRLRNLTGSVSAGSGSYCDGPYGVNLTLSDNVVTLKFCSLLDLERDFVFDGDGILDFLDGVVDLEFTSTASAKANLTISAMLEAPLEATLNFTLDVESVVAMVGVDATPTLELTFESIVLSSTANLSADGAVAVCVGDTSCDSFGAESVINATSTIEMYHSIGHDLSGELKAQVGSAAS